jgi:murein DD-endopeptidase MepM/ murein hydrolase activator NlpD
VGGRKSGFVRTGEVGAIRLKIGLISAVVMAVLVSHPSVAAAAEAHPAQVAARIQAVREALGRIGASLDEAEQDLARAEAAATRHRQAVATAAGRQAVLGKAISGRASAMYTMGSASMLETILGSESIDDFMARFSYLDQIRSREEAILEELGALRRRATIESAELAKAVSSASSARKSLESERGQLLAKLRELESLQNLLEALGGRSRSRSSRLSRAPNGFHCPVAGPNYVSNNYGDRRPGGPHTGVDIQADYGVPVVAVLPSTVTSTPYGSWIGVGIIIRDAAGNEWWYVHLSREYVTPGQRLAPGEMIGRVGCSGRCYGPHLHFEYHPGGGGPSSPYRILVDAC